MKKCPFLPSGQWYNYLTIFPSLVLQAITKAGTVLEAEIGYLQKIAG